MNFQLLFLPDNRNGNFFRKINAVINVILVLHQLFILSSEAYYLDNNPYRHKQILGPKASFVVEWSVNWKERAILFQVSAETKGWVGFGLSKDGRMFYSDGIIGGVDSFSGKPYFNDIHVKGNRSVQVDDRQDWKLIGAWEKGKRTYLSFTRAMDTCDSQDHPITKDLVALIWAYGESDEIQYHMAHRGSVPVYLLDPVISEEIAHDHYRQIGPHSNLYLVQRWAVSNTVTLSSRPASVWCSVKQGPQLLARHDIVGMGAFLPSKLARLHVQKMFLYKCISPQQTETKAFFDPYARLKGEECYLNEKKTLPLSFCRELVYVWGRGGKPFYFPEDIGIPIGESQTEYYLLETHVDNPKGKVDLEVEAGIEVIYSHRQKPNAASLLQIGYGPFGTFMIPPKTQMQIYGNCGPKCTSAMFPKSGANIFAVLLHSHTLGRRIRLKQFRNGATELPWILKDDNYDSEFQQMRLLSKQVTVLPGDQLTTECTYDSRERNRTSFSGFSSHDEACAAFVYVSMRIPFFRCTSELPADKLLSRFGVGNFTWDLNWQDRYVTFPKQLEGTWLGDVVDDDERQLRKSNRKQLQSDFKYSPHLESCPNTNDMMGQTQSQMFRVFTNDWEREPQGEAIPTKTPYLTSTVSYPVDANEYQEASYCRNTHEEYSDEFEGVKKITTTYAPQTSDEYTPQNSAEYIPQNSDEYIPQNLVEYTPRNSAEYIPQNRVEYTPQHTPRNRVEHTPRNRVEHTPRNGIEHTPRNRVEHSPRNRVEQSPRNRVEYTPQHTPRNRVEQTPRNRVEYTPQQAPQNSRHQRPLSDFVPAVPPPLPPPAPPLQHEDFYQMFIENSVRESSRPPSAKNIPIQPPRSQAPVNIFRFENEDGRTPSVPSSERIPGPRQPPSPPRQSSEFRRRPRPKNIPLTNVDLLPTPPSAPSPTPVLSSQFNKRPKQPKHSIGSSGALPIPPPPPRPPVQSFDFNDYLSDSQRGSNPQNPAGLRIPLVETKQPDATTDKSIMNFFEQIASLFSSSNSRDDPENIFSFQQYVHMNDNNLLKKRKAGAL